MALLDRLTGSSAAKLTDLNPLVDAINTLGVKVDSLQADLAATKASVTANSSALSALGAKVDSVRADHDTLRAEITARQAENRIGAMESYAQNNSRRIDEMEIRYNAVVEQMETIADNLTIAVADLAATDEVSGWKQWKEQRRQSL